LDSVLEAGQSAFSATRLASAGRRADWLRALADALDDASTDLIPLAQKETHLPVGRLDAELLRTSFQARLFADRLDSGALADDRVDLADPEWPMGPRPDIRRTLVPIGPVLVFAASNFPFAFSVVGGDTVSALAAGCPVVVKAHPGHPELSRATADIAASALITARAPQAVLSLIEGEQAGIDAIRDSRIKAVAFTGSTRGGRALFDLAMRRPDPIPFYGELGATNPVIVTPAGWGARPDDIATGFADSYTLGSGQFCTKPGVIFVPDADDFLARVPVRKVGPMLNDRIRSGFDAAVAHVSTSTDVVVAKSTEDTAAGPGTVLLRTSTRAVLKDPTLVEDEIFGPAALVVSYGSLDEVVEVMAVFGGTLTATVQGADGDPDAARLLDVLSEHAGRVIWNQWPTGVTVSDAQQHGGPWPSTTSPTTTSVGTAAIARFQRPVAYQNVPPQWLPASLRR
jgi:NADP-dependent aldehyde dehydrogenase